MYCIYLGGILLEEGYRTFDMPQYSIRVVSALNIVDDYNPKQNSKLRPTQCNAVIDAKLSLMCCTHSTHTRPTVHTLYSRC